MTLITRIINYTTQIINYTKKLQQTLEEKNNTINNQNKRSDNQNKIANTLVNQCMYLQQGNVILQNQNANLINELNNMKYVDQQSRVAHDGDNEVEIDDNNTINENSLPMQWTNIEYGAKRLRHNNSDGYLDLLKQNEKIMNQYDSIG